jgi:hypothetical protein
VVETTAGALPETSAGAASCAGPRNPDRLPGFRRRAQGQLDALSSLPEDKQTHLRALQRRLVACMSDCVREIEPERFRTRPELLAPVTMSVFGMLNWFYLWYKPGGPVDRDAYADIVADLVIGGLPAVCE